MRRPPISTLLALTFATGIVDAVTFLALGQVFSAMQTGNVIFLGLGIAGVGSATLGAPLTALGAFLLGNVVGGAVAARAAVGMRAAIATEVAMLALGVVIAAACNPSPGDASAYVLICVLSLTMGLRNTLVRGVSGPDIATTILNLTVTGLTTHATLALASEDAIGHRAAAFGAILAGAVAGALLLKTSLALALGGAMLVSLLAAALAARPSAAAAARS